MKNFCLSALLALFIAQAACQETSPNNQQRSGPGTTLKQDRQVGGSCECCEAWKDGIPDNLTWETQIAPVSEPGERLEISGTIFKKDGKTPASDIILYVYQTDADGNYSNGPGISACANRHGHLRGWVKTGTDGRFRFRTVRPASYPGTTIEQHIHAIIKEPGLSEYWIDSFYFDDDPNLPEKLRKNDKQRAGSGVLTLKKNEGGIWAGERDIVLGLYVPGY